MKGNWQRVLLMGVLVMVLGAPALLAQKYEFHPYGGFVWAGQTNVGRIKDQGMYGLKAGYFFDPSFDRFPHLAQAPLEKMICVLNDDKLLRFWQSIHQFFQLRARPAGRREDRHKHAAAKVCFGHLRA